MISRNISNHIADFIRKKEPHKNVLLVEGVRQVGKTTAVRAALASLGAHVLEINLEKEKRVRRAIDDSVEFGDFATILVQEYGFTPGAGRALFIDEASESSRLGHYVRQMKEDWRDQTVILTGSMMLKLFRDTDIRIPVGRYDRIMVRPFSYAEFSAANTATESALRKYGLAERLSAHPKTVTAREHVLFLELMNHYFNCGGVPTIALQYLAESGRIPAARAMLDYLESLKDDFLKLFSPEYANLFDRAIVSTANLLGQPYKKSAFVQNNYKLADNVLAIFENWKLIYKIEQKSPATETANSLHPKRYLFDVGIARLKREAGFPAIDVLRTLNAQQREPLGGLIEQFIVGELVAHWPQVSGFRDKTYEVDFVIKAGDQAIPIECKASLKINTHQYKGLDLYHGRYGNKLAVIISLAPYGRIKRAGYEVIHLPAYAVESLKTILV